MKILARSMKKWGEGYVTLVPKDDEDLWHIYNLIQKGDHIRMKTYRKIVDESNVTGVKKVYKKLLTLTILIVDIGYFAEGDCLTISIKGRNIQQNDYMKIGQFHTFRIELDLKLTIYKDVWPDYEWNLVKQLSSDRFGVQIAAMVLQQGVAHLCYVKPSITLLKQKIEKNISKKSCGEQIYRKSLNKFFNQCYLAIRNIDFDKIKCFVLASPGFLNDQLYKYVQNELEKENNKALIRNLQKFVLVKCATGYLNSLNEVLAEPSVMKRMQDTKAIKQSMLLQAFYDMMKKCQNRVAYGQSDVIKCIQLQAVETLLISDHLFRIKDLDKRRVYNQISEKVRKFGGDVVVFSSLHPSGQKLKNISGIAAILRFQVTQPEDQQEQQQQPINAENNNQGSDDQYYPQLAQQQLIFDCKKLGEQSDNDDSDN